MGFPRGLQGLDVTSPRLFTRSLREVGAGIFFLARCGERASSVWFTLVVVTIFADVFRPARPLNSQLLGIQGRPDRLG